MSRPANRRICGGLRVSVACVVSSRHESGMSVSTPAKPSPGEPRLNAPITAQAIKPSSSATTTHRAAGGTPTSHPALRVRNAAPFSLRLGALNSSMCASR
jgi:hypothetical protein